MLFWIHAGNGTQQKSIFTATYRSSHKPFKLDEEDMLGSATQVRTNSLATFFYGTLHKDTIMLGDQQRSVLTLDAV